MSVCMRCSAYFEIYNWLFHLAREFICLMTRFIVLPMLSIVGIALNHAQLEQDSVPLSG